MRSLFTSIPRRTEYCPIDNVVCDATVTGISRDWDIWNVIGINSRFAETRALESDSVIILFFSHSSNDIRFTKQNSLRDEMWRVVSRCLGS